MSDGGVDRKQASWKGTVGPSVCHPSGLGSCTYYAFIGEPSAGRNLSEVAPSTGFAANLTWTPTSPFTEELRFGLYEVDSCGDDCKVSRSVVERTGDSPIRVEANSVGDGAHALRVQATDVGPGPTRAHVVTGQPFQVEMTWHPASP